MPHPIPCRNPVPMDSSSRIVIGGPGWVKGRDNSPNRNINNEVTVTYGGIGGFDHVTSGIQSVTVHQQCVSNSGPQVNLNQQQQEQYQQQSQIQQLQQLHEVNVFDGFLSAPSLIDYPQQKIRDAQSAGQIGAVYQGQVPRSVGQLQLQQYQNDYQQVYDNHLNVDTQETVNLTQYQTQSNTMIQNPGPQNTFQRPQQPNPTNAMEYALQQYQQNLALERNATNGTTNNTVNQQQSMNNTMNNSSLLDKSPRGNELPPPSYRGPAPTQNQIQNQSNVGQIQNLGILQSMTDRVANLVGNDAKQMSQHFIQTVNSNQQYNISQSQNQLNQNGNQDHQDHLIDTHLSLSRSLINRLLQAHKQTLQEKKNRIDREQSLLKDAELNVEKVMKNGNGNNTVSGSSTSSEFNMQEPLISENRTYNKSPGTGATNSMQKQFHIHPSFEMHKDKVNFVSTNSYNALSPRSNHILSPRRSEHQYQTTPVQVQPVVVPQYILDLIQQLRQDLTVHISQYLRMERVAELELEQAIYLYEQLDNSRRLELLKRENEENKRQQEIIQKRMEMEQNLAERKRQASSRERSLNGGEQGDLDPDSYVTGGSTSQQYRGTQFQRSESASGVSQSATSSVTTLVSNKPYQVGPLLSGQWKSNRKFAGGPGLMSTSRVGRASQITLSQKHINTASSPVRGMSAEYGRGTSLRRGSQQDRSLSPEQSYGGFQQQYSDQIGNYGNAGNRSRSRGPQQQQDSLTNSITSTNVFKQFSLSKSKSKSILDEKKEQLKEQVITNAQRSSSRKRLVGTNGLPLSVGGKAVSPGPKRNNVTQSQPINLVMGRNTITQQNPGPNSFQSHPTRNGVNTTQVQTATIVTTSSPLINNYTTSAAAGGPASSSMSLRAQSPLTQINKMRQATQVNLNISKKRRDSSLNIRSSQGQPGSQGQQGQANGSSSQQSGNYTRATGSGSTNLGQQAATDSGPFPGPTTLQMAPVSKKRSAGTGSSADPGPPQNTVPANGNLAMQKQVSSSSVATFENLESRSL